MFFCETWQLQYKEIICGDVGKIIAKLLLPIHPTSCPPLCGTNLEHRFRTKYHPDEASRLKAETQSALNNRLNVFTFLMENGWFDNVSLDIDQSPAIIKVLDAGEINSDGVMKWKSQQSHTKIWRSHVCISSPWTGCNQNEICHLSLQLW